MKISVTQKEIRRLNTLLKRRDRTIKSLQNELTGYRPPASRNKVSLRGIKFGLDSRPLRFGFKPRKGDIPLDHPLRDIYPE